MFLQREKFADPQFAILHPDAGFKIISPPVVNLSDRHYSAYRMSSDENIWKKTITPPNWSRRATQTPPVTLKPSQSLSNVPGGAQTVKNKFSALMEPRFHFPVKLSRNCKAVNVASAKYWQRGYLKGHLFILINTVYVCKLLQIVVKVAIFTLWLPERSLQWQQSSTRCLHFPHVL